MLGDTVEMALENMKQTDQSQSEFYAMAQRNGEPIGKYAVRLNLAAGKVNEAGYSLKFCLGLHETLLDGHLEITPEHFNELLHVEGDVTKGKVL